MYIIENFHAISEIAGIIYLGCVSNQLLMPGAITLRNLAGNLCASFVLALGVVPIGGLLASYVAGLGIMSHHDLNSLSKPTTIGLGVVVSLIGPKGLKQLIKKRLS